MSISARITEALRRGRYAIGRRDDEDFGDVFQGGELVGKVERVEGSLVVYREFVKESHSSHEEWDSSAHYLSFECPAISFPRFDQLRVLPLLDGGKGEEATQHQKEKVHANAPTWGPGYSTHLRLRSRANLPQKGTNIETGPRYGDYFGCEVVCVE
jgi:hypothetical protein